MMIPAPTGKVQHRKGYDSYPWARGRVYIYPKGFAVRFEDLDELREFQEAHGGENKKLRGDSLAFKFEVLDEPPTS